MASDEPILVVGRLGWGNRKNGLEAYGPGGRWAAGRNGQAESGDLLGDALTEAGAAEGWPLLVVALPRGTGEADLAAAIEAVEQALAHVRSA